MSYEGDVNIKSSKDGHVLARVQVPLGATMIVADGGSLEREKDGKDPALFSWDPYTNPIIADVDVAMDHASRVRVSKGIGHLPRNRERVIDRQLTFTLHAITQ